jgi:hypothetical protein
LIASKLVHKWYKVKVPDAQLQTFNQRTKSVSEILDYLKQVCIIFFVFVVTSLFVLSFKDCELQSVLIG